VTGVVRKTEKKGNFTPENNLEKREFYWLDHDGLGRSTATQDYPGTAVAA
jgi:cytochrome oxidase assembly protein ShyY1